VLSLRRRTESGIFNFEHVSGWAILTGYFGVRKPCLRSAAAWLPHSKGSVFLLFAIN